MPRARVLVCVAVIGCGATLPPHARGRDVLVQATGDRSDSVCEIACYSAIQPGEVVASCIDADVGSDIPRENSLIDCNLVPARR